MLYKGLVVHTQMPVLVSELHPLVDSVYYGCERQARVSHQVSPKLFFLAPGTFMDLTACAPNKMPHLPLNI